MIINPIIPIWLMGIICVIFLFLRRKGVFNYIRQIIIVILLFVINLRIMVPGGTVTTVSADVDILFVCDNTISMLAEDYNGNGRRMDAVRSDCKYIVDQFPGASVSIITFDSSVEMKVPYTVDTFIVDQTFDSLNGEASYYANGSSLNMIMSQLEYFLDRGRDTYQLVFFVSDGEITMKGEELKTYDNLNQISLIHLKTENLEQEKQYYNRKQCFPYLHHIFRYIVQEDTHRTGGIRRSHKTCVTTG